MAVEREDVVGRWPAMAKVTAVNAWDDALADATAQVNPEVWGSRTDLAIIHLTAHLLALGNPAIRDPGLVRAERVGEIARDYAVSPLPVGFSFEATPYGKEYLRLQRAVGARLPIVP